MEKNKMCSLVLQEFMHQRGCEKIKSLYGRLTIAKNLSVARRTPLVPALGRHREADPHEFKAGLITRRVPGQPGLVFRDAPSQKKKIHLYYIDRPTQKFKS